MSVEELFEPGSMPELLTTYVVHARLHADAGLSEKRALEEAERTLQEAGLGHGTVAADRHETSSWVLRAEVPTASLTADLAVEAVYDALIITGIEGLEVWL